MSVRSLVCQRRILVIARDTVSIVVYVFTLCCFLASGLASLNLKGETDKMRRLALAIALACILSGMAHAGEIHTTRAPEPPTPGTVEAVTSEIPSTDETESTTVLTIILTLISIVP